MKELKQLPPKKTWRLARHKVTGRIYTDANSQVYCGSPEKQQEAINAATALRVATGENTYEGTHVPGNHVSSVYDSTLQRWRYAYANKTGLCMSDLELFAYIPVLRINLKFKKIYNGTSGASVIFEDVNGHPMVLRNSNTDDFFKFVGMGKIQMDSQGFYTVDVSFTKAGDKVYMELYGYG